MITILLGAIVAGLPAPRLVHRFEVEVSVETTKADGKAWDAGGGAPDVMLVVDQSQRLQSGSCRDTYRCTTLVDLPIGKDRVYLEIYDRDLASHDLIGKGSCLLKTKCALGRATVEIR